MQHLLISGWELVGASRSPSSFQVFSVDAANARQDATERRNDAQRSRRLKRRACAIQGDLPRFGGVDADLVQSIDKGVCCRQKGPGRSRVEGCLVSLSA